MCGTSGPGAPGKAVTGAVKVREEVARVLVIDRSRPAMPEPNSANRDEEGGRRLQPVVGLAERRVAAAAWRANKS
jgi:hypothetical protein